MLAFHGLRQYVEHHLGEHRHLSTLVTDTALPAATVWARVTGAIGLGMGTQPGARFRCADSESHALEGEVLCAYEAYGLLATIESLDDGLLALGMNPTPRGTLVWVSLSTFGDRRLAANEAELRLRPALERALNLSESERV